MDQVCRNSAVRAIGEEHWYVALSLAKEPIPRLQRRPFIPGPHIFPTIDPYRLIDPCKTRVNPFVSLLKASYILFS